VLLSLFVLLTKPITIPFNDSNQSHLKGSISVSAMCFQWLCAHKLVQGEIYSRVTC
jgi:hypothetical protein